MCSICTRHANTFGNDADTINVVVNDNGNTGTGGGSDQNLGTVNVDITAVNDEQVLTTNTGATVAEGSTGNVVTAAMLDTNDVDNTDAQLIYTVDVAPVNGTLVSQRQWLCRLPTPLPKPTSWLG